MNRTGIGLSKNILLAGLIVLAWGYSSSAKVLIRADEAVKKIYRQAETFEARSLTLSDDQIRRIEAKARITFKGAHSSQVIVHTAKDSGQTVGYAFEDTVAGKWGPIHYLVGLDANGVVSQIMILDYEEDRGRPIAKKRFLRQYKGKKREHPVRLKKDINGISGATISSRSLTDGVRKLLHIFEEIRNDLR